MLSPHSPKISLPSSGSSGKEATGPILRLLSPALGPGRECCRDAARMNKPGSSARAAGRSLLPPAWPRTGSGSAELLSCHVLQGDNMPRGSHSRWGFFGAPLSPLGRAGARRVPGQHQAACLGTGAGHAGGWQGRAPRSCSGSAPRLTLGPCSRDEVVCRGLRSSFRSKLQRAGRRGGGSHHVRNLPPVAAGKEKSCSGTPGRPRPPLDA